MKEEILQLMDQRRAYKGKDIMIYSELETNAMVLENDNTELRESKGGAGISTVTVGNISGRK